MAKFLMVVERVSYEYYAVKADNIDQVYANKAQIMGRSTGLICIDDDPLPSVHDVRKVKNKDIRAWIKEGNNAVCSIVYAEPKSDLTTVFDDIRE